MQANYQFSNLCGTVYCQGNVLFASGGNVLLSPVGNRVSVFDLVNNTSRTLPFENRKNIAVIALSANGNLLVSVDEDGRALLVGFRRGAVLHHMNFRKPVRALQFSPDDKFLAVTHGAHVQVWRAPNHLVREFAPFELHRTYTGHHDDVLSVQWSQDSRCFITTSRDMTARLFTLDPLEGFRPKTFAGHKDAVINAYFSSDGKTIYTVSRDGAVFTWKGKVFEGESESEDEPTATTSDADADGAVDNTIPNTRWGVHKRNYFHQAGTKVVVSTFHAPSGLLVVGFSSGVFGLWELPAFANLHTLSVAQERITAATLSPSGEWLALGAATRGQLLVWEWQSESYVLRQQGHAGGMHALAYAPDAQHIATGGADAKVKLWSAASGFCTATFAEHAAGVSALAFAGPGGRVLLSASLDGTVRAWDLVRYRNFRTLAAPAPVQFACVAADASGEVVAAGSADSFEVFLWSLQTGRLLDVLAGHTAPVSALAFSPAGLLASASWDRSVRLWSVFARARAVEPLQLGADVLALAFRPDGKELAAASLDGQLAFFDAARGTQTGAIDGRRDVAGARTAGAGAGVRGGSGAAFTSLAYSADGRCLLAGGNSAYVVLYDVREGVMLRRFQISQNLALAGTAAAFDSRLADADADGARGDDESDREDRVAADAALPGVVRGDLSQRRLRPEARTTCVRFAPTGRAWAAASPQGLLIYTLDALSASFAPADLDAALTPQAVRAALAAREHGAALVLALRLAEAPLLRAAYEAVPRAGVRLAARHVPRAHLPALLRLVAGGLARGPHLEFGLLWAAALLAAHGRYLRDCAGEFASVFRVLQRALADAEESVARLCDDNTSALSYLIDQSKLREAADTPMQVDVSAG